MTTPLICGSVVKNNSIESLTGGSAKITNLTFDRKLRMMRADIFALLYCSMNSSFIQKADTSQLIKKSLVKFLESELNFRVNQMGTFKQLIGWNRLLY